MSRGTDGPPAQPLAVLTTDDEGRFAFTIPKGPNRRISVRYRAFSTDKRNAAVWNFRVEVPAPVKLLRSTKHLRNGQLLLLTAHLSGTKVPARSANVAFQVRIGRRWQTFATRPIRAGGVATVGHRFRVTYQRMTYRFRAVVVKRRNFPFANATSRPVAVRVN